MKRNRRHQRTPPFSVVSPNTQSLCAAPFGGVFLGASVRSTHTFYWPWQPGSMRGVASCWLWIPLKWLTVGPELVLPVPCKLRTGFWCDPHLWDPGMICCWSLQAGNEMPGEGEFGVGGWSEEGHGKHCLMLTSGHSCCPVRQLHTG